MEPRRTRFAVGSVMLSSVKALPAARRPELLRVASHHRQVQTASVMIAMSFPVLLEMPT